MNIARLKTNLRVTERQQRILKELQAKGTLSHNLNVRITVVLKTVAGLGSLKISRELGISKTTAIFWRKRWQDHFDSLGELETAQEKTIDPILRERILEIFRDEQRSGLPRTFTEEQDLKIVALACESPLEAGIPRSHWTHELLAQEAARRGIVESISSSHIGRILKKYGHTTAPK